MRLSVLRAVGCAFIAVAAPAIAEDAGILANVRQRMVDNLAHLPDYTCLETIERSERYGTSARFKLVDVLRLEVGLVGGRELFSWPGADSFDDRTVDALVPLGSLGSGAFAMHAQAAFRDAATQFSGPAEETAGGRRLLRWDYFAPAATNRGWVIHTENKQGIAGTRGRFWADAETLDIVRLDAEATGIPSHLNLERVRDSVTYTRVNIGGGSFLLPASSESAILNTVQHENLNRMRFAECRQYLGRSEVHFEEDTRAAGNAAVALHALELPPDVILPLILETPIEFGTTAAGDTVRFRLESDVKSRKGVLLPKGATASGRITVLMNRDIGMSNYVVGIQMLEIRTNAVKAPLRAVLDESPGLLYTLLSKNENRQEVKLPSVPEGAGQIFLKSGGREVIGAGTRMLWRTLRIPTAFLKPPQH